VLLQVQSLRGSMKDEEVQRVIVEAHGVSCSCLCGGKPSKRQTSASSIICQPPECVGGGGQLKGCVGCVLQPTLCSGVTLVTFIRPF
jgi:hypothetical protein